MKFFLSIFLVLIAAPVFAGDRLITIGTRPGVSLSFFYQKQDGARATLILLPGGKGKIKFRNGMPVSQDFLVRSREHFLKNGFNVAIVDKPNDMEELDFTSRFSPGHLQDIRRVTTYVKEDTGLPVWLVGTSRGTISATAAAIFFEDRFLDGIVLTAVITGRRTPGAVPSQELENIRIPVLVVHHKKDECAICDPGRVPLIISRLTRSPAKKAIFMEGGSDPDGRKCGPAHRHGFPGLEETVVDTISEWIVNPAS